MAKAQTDYEALRPFATPRQLEILDALKETGSQRLAAQAVNIAETNVRRALRSLKAAAAKQGWSPQHDMTHPVPDGFKLKGTSTLYDAGGNVSVQWVKSEADRERQLAIMREVVAGMSSEIKRERVTKRRQLATSADLLNLYPITDYHLGMKAWHEETGADWDTAIAEDLLVAWFTRAIQSAPATATGVLALLGDLLHWDGLDAVTPEHRNILDADTRFEKLVRVVIRAVRRIVGMLLGKHDHLHIIIAEGNHDPASSAWMREMFAALYDQEPRVSVDQSPSPYYCYEFGQTSLFFHHGHRRNVGNVDTVFARQFREVFGRTKHAYAHLGHKHSVDVKETNLMLVEQHRTLAAPDAYSSRGGWLSGRGASVITYSSEFGEVGRVTISPEMVA